MTDQPNPPYALAAEVDRRRDLEGLTKAELISLLISTEARELSLLNRLNAERPDTYTVVERLDRPGNRADGRRGGSK